MVFTKRFVCGFNKPYDYPTSHPCVPTLAQGKKTSWVLLRTFYIFDFLGDAVKMERKVDLLPAAATFEIDSINHEIFALVAVAVK
jgi:hypothetical protein